jgi:conjugative transfer region lipoprotein (TIGR03751 family)
MICGCVAKTPFELAQQGTTIKENYENHISGGTQSIQTSRNDIIRAIEDDIELQDSFDFDYKRIANPELEMFIYPHRSKRLNVIVPSQLIKFPMYKQVQYDFIRDVTHE